MHIDVFHSKLPSVYTDGSFECIYTCVPLSSSIGNQIEYFQMRFDAIGKIGLSPLQKCTATILILAYGSFVDI